MPTNAALMQNLKPGPCEIIQGTSKADVAAAFVASGGLHYSKPQTCRPTIIFTNGYPDGEATVQDVRDRVERLKSSLVQWQWSDITAGAQALYAAEAELRDLGVAL